MADGHVSASSEAASSDQRDSTSELQNIPDPATYISSLKTVELKAELNKRGLKQTGNKSVLTDRLLAAIQSQDHGEESTETSSSDTVMDEHETACPCSNDKLTIDDLSSFIEAKVNEVCRFEIENLKSEASASYVNDLVLSLRNENKDLQDKFQDLESHYITLKREANSLREENKSLLTVIRLMNNELQNPAEVKSVPSTATNISNLHEQTSEGVTGLSPGHDKESSWVPVIKSKQRSKRKRRKKANLPSTANPAEPQRLTTERTPNAEQQLYANHKTDHAAKKKLVFIAGDSMIQHVQGWDLSTNDKHVAVKSFSGARIADMEDYLKPLLRKKPDEIILHVGTNNIRDESSRSVAEGIVNLVTQIQQDYPSTHLAISPLLPRSDNLDLNDKVKEANKILKSFCSSRGLTLLRITNIDLTCLNSKGVHLNRKGSSLLSNCYDDYLNSH